MYSGHGAILGLLFALLGSVTTALPAEIAPGYIDKIARAYGDGETVAGVDSYRVIARTEATLRSDRSGTVVREVLHPDELRVRIDYSESTELRVLRGPAGWRGSDRSVVSVEGPLLDSMTYQLLRSDLPWALVRYENRLVDGGLAQDDEGNPYRILVLPWSDRLEVRYWIEASSLRITRVEGTIRVEGPEIAFRTEYGDFRNVGGVWFPHREINHASGRKVAETTLTGVELNPGDLGPFTPE